MNKFFSYFKTRNGLMDEFEKLNKIADSKLYKLAEKLRYLEQDQLYLLSDPDLTREELELFQEELKRASKMINWSLPPIVIVNKEVGILSVINRKYAEILISLEYEELNLKECSKKVGMNYHHLHIVMTRFEKEGIIKKEKPNAVNKYFLTEQGKAVVESLKSLIEHLTNWEQSKEKKKQEKRGQDDGKQKETNSTGSEGNSTEGGPNPNSGSGEQTGESPSNGGDSLQG